MLSATGTLIKMSAAVNITSTTVNGATRTAYKLVATVSFCKALSRHQAATSHGRALHDSRGCHCLRRVCTVNGVSLQKPHQRILLHPHRLHPRSEREPDGLGEVDLAVRADHRPQRAESAHLLQRQRRHSHAK